MFSEILSLFRGQKWCYLALKNEKKHGCFRNMELKNAPKIFSNVFQKINETVSQIHVVFSKTNK